MPAVTKTGPVVAHGRGFTVTRHRGRITVRPTLWTRLTNPWLRTARFRVRDVRLVEVREPGWLRRGRVYFELDVQPRRDDEEPGCLVEYDRRRRGEFVDLIAGAGWHARLPDLVTSHLGRQSIVIRTLIAP